MNPFGKIYRFLLSLRTSVWLFFALIGILFVGSFVMPSREEFAALHTVPLFQWLIGNDISITWWLWSALGILVLMAFNTVFCSAESLLRKRGARGLALVISPQVIHAGFLFILLAHLLSSYGSFKGVTAVAQGSVIGLPNGVEVLFETVNANVDPSGYITEWSADVAYLREGEKVASGSVLPNEPSFYDGYGVYIKTVRFDPFPVAIIEVSRDPGAVWALVGGILFLSGIFALLVLKIRREEAQ